jgi:DNA-binding response OmpR family regulator
VEKYKVLLVDDEEELVATLVERLAYRGFDAEYAVNANVALTMLRELAFDIVVVDLKLPGMPGSELVHVIRKAYPHIPVIVITGHGSDEDQSLELPDGASGFLAKPFDVSQLLIKMKEALESDVL